MTSGPQAPMLPENVQKMMGTISMEGHGAELAGGVNLLASSGDVDTARIFALTNSEGCVHALNYQNRGRTPPFAGMVLTSAFARTAGELAHSQLAAQLAAVPGGDAMLSAYDASMNEFLEGRPVHVNEILPEGLRQVILGITQPANQPFARELWAFNPVGYLAGITVPVLIVIGKKDIQVDWKTDGPLFEAVVSGHGTITIIYPEHANHVLKFEPGSRSQLTPAGVMAAYNADDTKLDPDTVTAIISWLRNHLSAG